MLAQQIQRTTRSYPFAIWDVHLDPYWRAVLARLAGLPPSAVEQDWIHLDAAAQTKLTLGMWDALRLGRAMTRGTVQ